tara:strand:- start:683 stop:1645 length:963 start_codon:yes stop_codon:yes gene_type:complete
MILLRYLIRDIFSHTLSVSLIFLFISFSSRSIQYLEEVVKGNLESETVLWLVLLRMPEFLEIIIPFSFFIAILLVVGRLYSQGEYVILQQNGLSTLNICKIVALLGLFLGIIILSINQFFSPLVDSRLSAIKAEKTIYQKVDLVRPGYFTRIQENMTFHVSDKKDGNMENVFIRFLNEENKETFILAKKGILQENKIKLIEGTSFSKEEESFEKLTFSEMGLNLLSHNSNIPLKEIERKLNWIFVIFLIISGLIALLLSEVKPRESRYKNLIPALIIYVIYFGLFLFVKESNIFMAEFYVHIPFLFFLIYLFITKRAWQR